MDTGVRCIEPACGDRLIHRYAGGDYGLGDIPELFALGSEIGAPADHERIVLTAAEIRELRTMADAYSFDFETGLIELCLDLHRFAQERRETRFVFDQDF